MICILIGITQDLTKTKQVAIVDEYNYINVVQVSKQYQCPIYCKVEHNHFVYYTDKVKDKRLMTIEKPNYKKLKKVFIIKN